MLEKANEYIRQNRIDEKEKQVLFTIRFHKIIEPKRGTCYNK